ncbi:MAG: ATP-binding cassette domain-containing protein [Bacteroidota bacterium]
MDDFLRLEGVSKQYDQHLAVDSVSLRVPPGKIYGLLGPNGAGKTSIIRMITGITAPDQGQIWFDGEPLAGKHTRRIGYMPEERGLYKKMKVKEQIVYLLGLRGMSSKGAQQAADHWLAKLGLSEWAKRKTMDLSKGMQQKVQFITTVAHEPRLLILDEPFSGLDPVNTHIIEQEIRRMASAGTTIIFSTHRMEQVEELCDEIALMNQGKKILEDRIDTVRQQFQEDVFDLSFVGEASVLAQVQGIEIKRSAEGQAQVELLEGQSRNDLLRQLADSPLEITRFVQHTPRLNEIFIQLVGYQPQVEANA